MVALHIVGSLGKVQACPPLTGARLIQNLHQVAADEISWKHATKNNIMESFEKSGVVLSFDSGSIAFCLAENLKLQLGIKIIFFHIFQDTNRLRVSIGGDCVKPCTLQCH